MRALEQEDIEACKVLWQGGNCICSYKVFVTRKGKQRRPSREDFLQHIWLLDGHHHAEMG